MVTDELMKLVKNLDETENQLDILQRDIMRRVFADFGDRLVKFLSNAIRLFRISRTNVKNILNVPEI